MATRNARFWIFVHGSDVKITLRPGDEVQYSHSQDTDEGWRRESRVYTFDGVFVRNESHSRERDCDGLMEHFGEYLCHVDNLKDGPNIDGIGFPAWEKERESQRDHSAERAGY